MRAGLPWFAAAIFLAVLVGTIAFRRPEAAWSAPMLAGAVAGGIASLLAIGLAIHLGRRAPETDDSIAAILGRIEEHSMLSDQAKRLVYRDRELELLRMLLEQDIASGDFDAAMRMVDELGNQFGRREEAEGLRTRIDASRREEVERRIGEGTRHIARLLAAGDWNAAAGVQHRLERLFPDAPSIASLPEQILAARLRHAAEVETRLRVAHATGRVDEAMTLLRDLDSHLVGRESTRVLDVAQPIVAAHRERCGVRFRDAINAREWKTAVELGERLVEEYPNTRMAEEATELLAGLRNRAGLTSDRS
jgi:hypothetical protein